MDWQPSHHTCTRWRKFGTFLGDAFGKCNTTLGPSRSWNKPSLENCRKFLKQPSGGSLRAWQVGAESLFMSMGKIRTTAKTVWTLELIFEGNLCHAHHCSHFDFRGTVMQMLMKLPWCSQIELASFFCLFKILLFDVMHLTSYILLPDDIYFIPKRCSLTFYLLYVQAVTFWSL